MTQRNRSAPLLCMYVSAPCPENNFIIVRIAHEFFNYVNGRFQSRGGNIVSEVLVDMYVCW